MKLFSIERLFELCRQQVSQAAVENFIVVPMNQSEGCQRQFFRVFQGYWMVGSSHESSLVIAVHGFRNNVVKGIPDGSNGGDSTNLGEAFATVN